MKQATALHIEDDEISIGEAIAEAVDALVMAGIFSAHLDARVLLAHVLGVGREYLTLNSDAYLETIELGAFHELVTRRVAREPMSHILGEREFWSLPFRVTQDTLDPRPDSETLVEAVMDMLPKRDAKLMIADFGTGTGCLLLSVLSEYPKAHGLAVDISAAALKVAEENAEQLGLSNRVFFHCANWGEDVMGRYDVIISNPPYIPDADIEKLQPEVSKYEPRNALAGGEDGLDAYRNLMSHISRLLSRQGFAALECGVGQAKDVSHIAEKHGLKTVETRKDLAGVERCVVLMHDR